VFGATRSGFEFGLCLVLSCLVLSGWLSQGRAAASVAHWA
jgi:hypothetical protein